MNKLKVFLLIFSLILAFGFMAFAQEASEINVTEEIELDEEVTAGDLETGEPQILPDSTFYFLKNWGRGIRLFFAFGIENKAKLRLRFANERLIEIKKLVELKKDPKTLESALENFQQELEEIGKTNPENLKNFSEKLMHQQLLHQRILQKLETQVPAEVYEKIKENRERHLERFTNVMQKVEENFPEKLEEVLEKQKGSRFKEFKNLEILLELEEKVPEEAKEAILRAQENALKRLQGDLERLSPEDQEKFKEYLEKISGDKEKQLEILENLKERLEEKPALQQKIIESKERVSERIQTRERERAIEETWVCTLEWDPVCGKDGKTYSNECFANIAGVEIDYEGMCKEEVEKLLTFFYLVNQSGEEIEIKVWADGQELFTQEMAASIKDTQGIEIPPLKEYPTKELKTTIPKEIKLLKIQVEFPVGSALAGKEKEFEIAQIPGKAGFRITITKTDIVVTRDYLPIR